MAPLPGVHQLTIHIDSADGSAVWFDTIGYWSLVNPDLTNEYSEIAPSDPSVRYFGRGWMALNVNQERYNYLEGSRVSISFHGQFLSLLLHSQH